MIRFLILSAAFLAVPLAVHAQTPTPVTPAPASQLDRIEQKLDEVLRRLDQRDAARTAAAPAGPGVISSQSSAAAAAPPQAYKPGALAVARAAPHDPNNFVAVPADAVGGFVYAGGAIPLNEITTRDVRYTGPVGIELQGWLRAREAGRYELATDIDVRFTAFASYGITCFYQAWV